MKEIVIMVGPSGPDQKLVNMLKTLFPECVIRLIPASNKSLDSKGETQSMVKNNHRLNNG